MVKKIEIIYLGCVSPCRVRGGGMCFDNWVRGEVKVVTELMADKLLVNNYFSVVGKKEEKKEEIKEDVVVEKENNEEEFDINFDGVVDDEDASLAGKVLANKRKKVKNKEE